MSVFIEIESGSGQRWEVECDKVRVEGNTNTLVTIDGRGVETPYANPKNATLRFKSRAETERPS